MLLIDHPYCLIIKHLQYIVDIPNNMQQIDQKQLQTTDKRVYFQLLNRVGSHGKYQSTAICILVFLCFLGSSTFFILPYLLYIDPYNCPDSVDNCQSFRAPYRAQQSMSTLAYYFGDLRCQRADFLTLLQYLMLFGAFAGIFVALIGTDYLGRRRTFLMSYVIALIGLILVFAQLNTWTICVGLFLYGMGFQISYNTLYTTVTQITDEDHRGTYFVYMFIAFGFGTMGNAIAFYFIKNYRIVILCYYLIPVIISLVLYWYFVEATPLQLISKYSVQDCYNAFIRIAERNQKPNHNITLGQIQLIQQDYKKSLKKNEKYTFWFIDLFRYASVRPDIIKVSCLFFCIMFQLYAPALLFGQLKMSIYVNGILNGVSQLATIPILGCIVMTLSRPIGQMIIFTGIFIFGISIAILSPQTCHNCMEGTSGVIISILFFGFRFFSNLSSNFFATTLTETFPAQIRNIAVFFLVSIGRLSSLLIPVLIKIKITYGITLMSIFSVFAVLGFISAYFIRQTVNIPPGELLQEFKEKKQDQ